jgi:hypothetical protein
MTTVTTEQLQTDFDSVCSLIDRGETFCLKENGVFLGTFSSVAAEHRAGKRILGNLQGKIKIPEDFDTMMRDEIEAMFYGNE